MSSIRLEDIVKRRAGHVLVSHKDELYMWGGYMEESHTGIFNIPLNDQFSSQFHNPNEIWIYSPFLNIWRKKICTGDIPPKLSGSCAEVIGHKMYVFGGFCEDRFNGSNYNKLYCLDLKLYEWKLLTPNGFQPYACDKCSSWVYSDRFYIFGGYGPNIHERGNSLVNVLFESESENMVKGWIDQLVFYDTSNDCWTWPWEKGLKPTPRAAHAATVLKNKAYIFGGRHKENRLNDFHVLDMEMHHWSPVPLQEKSLIPKQRSWHTLNTISDDKILLYGGFSSTCQVLNDAWIFNIRSFTWKQLPSNNYSKRLWHCGALIGKSEVLFVGGISNNILNYSEPKKHAENMQRIRLSPPSLFDLTLEYMSTSKAIHKKTWVLLPLHLRKVLEVRVDPFEIHGLQA